ncbi:MAG: hypothetical protein KBF21_13975 [Thermoanaerobaculia bacterium]|nr:hypothetical protein [Thermoanaerobaculia bacterium]MBP9825327.1 hypothetical protein [Thermoanaerobaculia bacterium]
MRKREGLLPGFDRRRATIALGLMLAGRALAPAMLGAEELPPRFREAVDLFAAGKFKECQIAFTQAAGAAPRAGLAARASYGAACCAAVRNDLDGGYEALALALDNGFVDLERALADPRLETLRADARWMRFITLLEERQQMHQKALDPDLLRLYLELQGERDTVARELPATGARDAGAVAPTAAWVERSLARREEAAGLVSQGRVRQPEDAFHAAALLVESERPAEVALAAELGRQALARDPDLLAARPLVATAVDRGEMLAGRPQKYGTQFVEEGGKWKVYAVDPAVTDAERAEWGLPPLADAVAQAAEINLRAANRQRQAAPSPPPPK